MTVSMKIGVDPAMAADQSMQYGFKIDENGKVQGFAFPADVTPLTKQKIVLCWRQ